MTVEEETSRRRRLCSDAIFSPNRAFAIKKHCQSANHVGGRGVYLLPTVGGLKLPFDFLLMPTNDALVNPGPQAKSEQDWVASHAINGSGQM